MMKVLKSSFDSRTQGEAREQKPKVERKKMKQGQKENWEEERIWK